MATRESLTKDTSTGVTDSQAVSVYDQTTTPSNEATIAKIYAKDVAGTAKMHALDSAGVEIELGSGGGGASLTTLTSGGGNVPVDADLGPNYELELTEATTELNNPTNLVEGQTFVVLIKQDSTGSRALTFGTDWLRKDGITTTIADALDTVTILRGTSANLPNGPGLRVYYTLEHEEESGGGSHASTHITGAGDEIDGDQLDIDFTPSNYTPDVTPSEVTSVDHLSAHLAGIDTALVGGGSVAGAGTPQHSNNDLSPVGRWTLNEVLTDGSGNGHDLSVASGVERYTGHNHVPGDASAFLQTTRLSGPSDAAFELTGEVTIMAWINPYALSPQIVVSYQGAGESSTTNTLWSLRIDTSGSFNIFHEFGSGSNQDFNGTNNVIRPGQNQHLALSREADGVTHHCYLNGVFVETVVASTAPDGGSASFVNIGRGADAESSFQGSIWDVAVYGSQLTSEQIKAEYRRQAGVLGVEPATIGPQHSDARLSPVVQYTLNEVLTDGSGNGHDLSVGTGTEDYSGQNHVPGDASFRFDAASRLTGGSIPALAVTGEVSVLFWCSPESTTPSYSFIAGYTGSTEASADNALWVVYIRASGAIELYQESGGGVDAMVTSDTGLLQVGVKNFVAVTRDSAGTGVNMYVNGVLVHTGTAGSAPDGGGSSVLHIGAFANDAEDYAGSLWDLMVLDTELSAEQIKAEYQRQVGGNSSFDSTTQTTDAVAKVIHTVPTVTDQSTWVEATVQGIDNTAKEVAFYKFSAFFYNNAGTVTQKGTTTTLDSFEDDASWNFDLNISGTDVQIRVIGDATNAVEWRVLVNSRTHG